MRSDPAKLPDPPVPAAWWRRWWLGEALLVASALLVYLPCLNGGFIWDDGAWTTSLEPLHRNPAGLWKMWSDPVAMQQYYPLTGTSFWLDWQLWGGWPLPYHVENVLLHALSAVLVWRVLRHLRVPGAGLAAALFTLHPMMGESVAWITERKNVLSLVLVLAALLSYWRFEERADNRGLRTAAWRWYLVALLLFAAALLAKITAFILPPTLLLLVWWRRGRVSWRQDVLPTLPFFAFALGLGLLITWLEKHHVGAEGADFNLTLAQRCLLAGRAFWFYAAKLLWPLDLRLFYPKWTLDSTSLAQWLYPVSAVAALVSLWLAREKIGRGVVVAVLLYLGPLLPVLGFLNVYGMFLADVADRWVHVSAISLLALVAAGMVRGLARWPKAVLTPWLMLPLLAVLTWRHASHYGDPERFWRTALKHNPDCWVALNNLGGILVRQQKRDEAKDCVQRALALRPGYAEAHANLGNLLRDEGRIEAALDAYGEALKLQPDYPDVYNHLGIVYQMLGQTDKAVSSLQKAIEIQPSFSLAHNNLGNIRLSQGEIQEAMACFQRAITLQPAYPDAHNNLGLSLLNAGRHSEALQHLEKAVELRPDYPEALNNLGHALLQLDRRDEAAARLENAIQLNPGHAQAHHNLALCRYLQGRVQDSLQHYQKAVEADPRQLGSMNNLAWILATYPDDELRDGERALQIARQADELTQHRDPVILHTLAAAQAECGQFIEAMATAKLAVEQALGQNNPSLAQTIQEQRSRYEAGRAFRDVKAESK